MGSMSLRDNDPPVIVFCGGVYLLTVDTSTEEYSTFLTSVDNDFGVVGVVEGGDGDDILY